MSENKKNSLLLTNFHVLYVLEDKTSQKNFRLFVCLYVGGFYIFWARKFENFGYFSKKSFKPCNIILNIG